MIPGRINGTFSDKGLLLDTVLKHRKPIILKSHSTMADKRKYESLYHSPPYFK